MHEYGDKVRAGGIDGGSNSGNAISGAGSGVCDECEGHNIILSVKSIRAIAGRVAAGGSNIKSVLLNEVGGGHLSSLTGLKIKRCGIAAFGDSRDGKIVSFRTRSYFTAENL